MRRSTSHRVSAASRSRQDSVRLAARGESLASHRDGRGAPLARRDDREYREYLSEEQRSRWGCIARRMQPGFRHGLLAPDSICRVTGKLTRSIGLTQATAMVVGTIVGSSIFVQPSEVSRAVPTFVGMLL